MNEPSHPKNPLAGRSGYTNLLLQELSDAEVAEFCDYWSARRDDYRAEVNGFAEWNASKRLSTGGREATRRGLDLERI